MKASRLFPIGLLVLLLSSLLLPSLAKAQGEVQGEVNSLKAINSFYFVVNVEGNEQLTSEEQLNVTDLQTKFHNYIKKAGLNVLPSNIKTPAAAGVPFLRLHINVMNAGRGLIPFAINLNLYQPVKLVLDRNHKTLASTWNTGNVGIVSYNKLNVIEESAQGMLDEFIQDYKKVNPNRIKN